MTNKKRFNFVGGYLYDGNKPIGHVEDIKFRQDFEDIVNNLHEENQELLQVINRCSDSHLRMRNRLERLHKDWDKLWDICKEQGMTDEEIIKEMDR